MKCARIKNIYNFDGLTVLGNIKQLIKSGKDVFDDGNKVELNGRKITVLYEGVVDPQRTPVFVRDLTTDQKDILNQRLNDHRTGKSTKCVNTDEEIRELQKNPPTNDAYTQTNFTTDISLLEVLLKNSTQVQQLLPQLSKRKHPDQLEETNNPSLVEYLHNTTSSPRYEGLSAYPVARPMSPLSPLPTHVCPGTPSPECSPLFPELCRRVQQTTTFNSTQMQPSVPSQPFHDSVPSNTAFLPSR
ncbi:unnamed protein product [Mytilus edulis]|uniref:Uncharacterized protein n=1 Tax=Mytilus edulis TaxID=6550 RepID=A0A8S3RJT6_MYTED|nr:unnamed protein product [Mytilus edulis]